jgi:hypothetical protein
LLAVFEEGESVDILEPDGSPFGDNTMKVRGKAAVGSRVPAHSLEFNAKTATVAQ